MFKAISKLSLSVSSKNGVGILYTQTESVGYRAVDLWRSVLSVSNQGSKKGRGKRMGRAKDLNMGQSLGDGKLQVKYPGLNEDIQLKSTELPQMKVIGEDLDREKRLTEIRNKMDRFKHISVSPFDRGFTSSSIAGKPIGPPDSYEDVDFSKFDSRIIFYKSMMQHKSILGKKKSILCFVITGNGNGILGYGSGRGTTAAGAVKMAKIHASQRLLYINRYEDRTLFHNFYEEYYFTKVYAERMVSGYGLVCHRVIKKICQLAGIKDVYAKVEGSKNPRNVAKAFIGGLVNQKNYQDIADEKNLHVIEIKPEMKNFPVLLARAKNPIVEDKLQSDDYQKNIDLYLFHNMVRLDKKKKKPFYANYDSYKKYCIQRDKDKAQILARVKRFKQLPDDLIMAEKYPRKPKPKTAEPSE